MVELSAVGGAGAGEGRMKLGVGVVGVRDAVVVVVGRAVVVVAGAALVATHNTMTRHARNNLRGFVRVIVGMDMIQYVR